MVDVVDEVPEAQIPQLLHLPQAERLIEADVEDLLNISLIVVQIVHLNKEVAGEVPHVNPLLMEIASVYLLGHYLAGGQSGGGRWKKEDTHSLLSPLLASSYCQGLGRGMRRGLSSAGEWAFY